jgi:hypothetical protein
VGQCDRASGNCKAAPVADGTKCDDASSCTLTDQCTAGKCAGQGNACGPNASACMVGTPNKCTCNTDYLERTGLCIPTNDECASATPPCSPNATCFDTSNAPNTVTCTCKPGFAGDGHNCYALEPCKNNPCGDGRGTCTAGALGAYTCACATGFVQVAGQCVCDMTGTFAGRTQVELSWKAQDPIEAGAATSYSWSIQRQMYDDKGNLDVEVIPCGDNNIDLCGNGYGNLVPVEAYAQYVPAAVWGSSAQRGMLHLSLPNAIPNADYKTPQMAGLQGITLTDPFGDWPPNRKDIQGGPEFDGSAVNGARWVDADGDGVIGMTTYTVGPGGIAAGSGPTAPLETYKATSDACPRANPNAPRSPYNYPPAAEGVTVRRVKRFGSANRSISALEGKINSCDLVSGAIVGPNAGKVHYDVRIGMCVRVNGSDESACNATLLDFLDSNTQSDDQSGGKFVLKRAANATITCDDVRKMKFD